MNFGLNIKNARENANLSQKQLSEKTGVTQAMISQVEKGIKAPSLPVAYQIAKACGVTVDDLCKGAFN